MSAASEFGGLGVPEKAPADALDMRLKRDAPANTTIAIVATDARLSKAQMKRVAIMAQDGIALALRPAHAPMDGDIVFAATTSRAPREPDLRDLAEIGMLAAECLARAIARGVYEATAPRASGDAAVLAGAVWAVAGAAGIANREFPVDRHAKGVRRSIVSASARSAIFSFERPFRWPASVASGPPKGGER